MAPVIVVRRDATATFQHLRETWAAKLGSDLELIWDRRTRNRRHPGDSVPVERRVHDRREADPEPLDLDEARWGDRRQQPELRMPDRRRAERRGGTRRRPGRPWASCSYRRIALPLTRRLMRSWNNRVERRGAVEVGRRIAMLRQRLGLSQVAFARQAGISRNALVEYRTRGSGAENCEPWADRGGRRELR
jgi:hypothetical protein